MAHVQYPSAKVESGSEKRISCLFCCIWKITDCLCCYCSESEKKPQSVAPLVMTQPVLFSDPARPGYQEAPSPPEGKGSSIVFEEGVKPEDLPVGFYVTDLTHNHQAPFAYPS